ncbi:hypothetical protein [Pseudalgibacter alginicilyticus]|uniref:hypothetical protein n=1 Tax=Pseudalgibacter alginicilyticus TaxID=1736674 RepID=UPI0026AC6DAA
MKNIHCVVFGHNYKVTKRVTYYVKEYTCSRCKKQLTTNGNGNLVPLTPKFKEINDVLERIHQNRHLKSRMKHESDAIEHEELDYIEIKHKVSSIDRMPTINTESLLVFKH